ncbi:hypothetical protein COOONC_10466, partial [Cooperia oncophora]
LPLYEEDLPPREYVFVEEEPLPLQREFATIRKSFQAEYNRVAEQFQFVDKTVQKSKNALIKTKTYVDEEWTVLPKAAAITVGGMAGFVLGLKRGFIGRTFTTAVGLATMTAFLLSVRNGRCSSYRNRSLLRVHGNSLGAVSFDFLFFFCGIPVPPPVPFHLVLLKTHN